MKTYTIQCVLLIATVSLFAQGQGSSSVLNTENANVTFECDCSKVNDSNADLTASQTTYHCACQTYLESGQARRACFYNCSKENYTCEVNEFCENLTFCNRSCHEYATCVYKNESYGKYECVCNEGFRATGNDCLPKTGCGQLDCGNVTQPKVNCTCENKTYCCTTNDECPTNCSACDDEEPIFTTKCTQGGNLRCWCKDICDRVHGNFSNWSNWTECSRLCGVGERNRTRNCSNPARQNGGRDCYGPRNETEPCNITACPIIGFSQRNYTVNENNGSARLEVKLFSGTVVENFTIEAFTAPAKEEDYQTFTSTVFSPADSGPKFITIELINDNLIEKDETFSVTFTTTNPDVVVVENSTTVTIQDDDVAEVKFANNSYSVDEGVRELNVTIILTGNITFPVHVRLDTNNVTADPGKDYERFVNKTETFYPNASNGRQEIHVPILIYNDDLVENNETFSVTLSSKSLPKLIAADPNSTAITIIDNDVAFVSFQRSNYLVAEGDNEVTVSVILTGNITIPVHARLVIRNASAEVGNDFNTPMDTDITFSSNDTKVVDVSFTILNDNVVEENETFSVTLSSRNWSSLAVADPNSTIITIVDNDIDGNFTDWSVWGDCSRSCGIGSQQRTRTCTNPEPKGEGKNCTVIGNSTEIQSCNNSLICPMISNWSNWTPCSVTCGKGNVTRFCLNNTGYGCNGTLNETKDCDLGACPVDGYFNEWGSWAKCSKTCGNGVKSRTRKCIEPQNNGKNCSGLYNDTSECSNPAPCPGEEGFGLWSDWSECSVTCLQGIQTRQRTCNDDTKKTCQGDYKGNQTCDMGPCPVNGNWSGWSEWSLCPGSCGSSFVERQRKCDNPLPKYRGRNCTGNPTEVKGCNHSKVCDGESGFTQWSEWSPCSATCGDGVEVRTRKCNEYSAPSECNSTYSQNKSCYHQPCPVNGGWSVWSVWGGCSSSCGSGKRTRKRTCTNPEKSIDGLPCYGQKTNETLCVMPDDCKDDYAYQNWESWSSCSVSCGDGKRVRKRECKLLPKYPPEGPLPCESPSQDYEYISCFPQPCSIDGNFTNWSFWSLCSVTCGDGVQKRTRSCTHPTPDFGGRLCRGRELDVKDCYTNIPCPDDKFYLPWSSWSNCSNFCEGVTNRTRNCNMTFLNCNASSASKECNTKLCDVNGGWSVWTSWSSCDDKKCGDQHERRERLCNEPKPRAAGNYCTGQNEQTTSCSTFDPKPCTNQGNRKPGWTDWSWWKPCSKSCGGGVKSRYRKCSNPRPSPGGPNCTGNSSMSEECNIHPCPVDGNFAEWSPWTNCTKPECGNGTQTRNRSCTNPIPQHGGLDCDGPTFSSQACNVHPCPIHGNFTPWSRWSFCSKPCNKGVSRRTRSCTNPAPMFNGRKCSCKNTKGIFSYDNCTDVVKQEYPCNSFVCPPVKVFAEITYKNSFIKRNNSDLSNKKALKDYILKPYRETNHSCPSCPLVGVPSCRSHEDMFTCNISVLYNFSDADQLPILRDILDQPHGSNIFMLRMDSSVVLSTEINMTAVNLSSTSIKVNWSLDTSLEGVTSITVFYKILNGTPSFNQKALPTSLQGGVVLENLKKFTLYKITVAPTTKNGTGIPSRFATVMTLEDVPSKAPQVKVYPNSTSLNVTWKAIDREYLHGIHRGYCLYFDEQKEELGTDIYEIIRQNLRPYTEHYIQVAARTTPDCGTKSQRKPFFTLEDRPGGPPEDLTAHNESSTSILVEWKEVNKTLKNGNISGYHITYTKLNGRRSSSHLHVPGTTLHTVITDLSVWTKYHISVAAYTKVGTGPAANVTVSTEEGTPPIAPELIVAENRSSTSIYIKWREINQSRPDISQTGYGILLGYELTYIEKDYKYARKRVIRVNKTTTEYNITGLFYYWRYNITIGGFTRPGVGKLAKRMVQTDEHPPGRSPENVRGIAKTSTSISVEWDKVTSNYVHGILTGYNVTVRKTSNLSKLVSPRDIIYPNKVRSCNLKGLEKYTEYTIWVRAVNSKGHGKLNRPEGYRVRTLEDAPEAPPSKITVKSFTSISSLNLAWDNIPPEHRNGIIRGYYVEYTATKLNGKLVDPGKQVTKTFHVRGNRFATILTGLIPGSTYEIKMFGYTIKSGTKSEKIIGETCRCPEYLKVNWWNIPPYTDGNEMDPGGIFSHTVKMMLDMCGTCENGHGRTKACYRPACGQRSSRRRRSADSYQQNSFQEVLNNIKDDVDISFPIQGNKYMTHYGGVFPYISVVETSGSVFFTVKKIPSTAHVLVGAAINTIPLLFLVLLLSILAGIIIWALERSCNPTSFPLSFIKGLKEGFWWAFISASTVGYGDRRPVTIPGKLFAICWILVGYIIIQLLTSAMTNSITLILVTQKKSIYGAKVAVIQNSTEYGKAIQKNGKVAPFSNVNEVVKALEDKIVDGALLDMYAAATRKDLFQSGDIQLNRQVEYPTGYGIVLSGRMKHSAPMLKEYFKQKTKELLELIQNNTDVITQKQNKVQEAAKKKSGLFDASSSAFQLSLIVLVSLLSASLAVGLFWHVKYHRKAVNVRENLRNSTPGYKYYKHLREDVKDSCKDHFQELMSKLEKMKKRHVKELKLLAKCYKNAGRPWPIHNAFASSASSVGSFTRVRKMTASVTPSLNKHSNIALEVLEIEKEHENHRSKDSQV